ncbi:MULTISPECIES: GGDEF domain-containing protein [Delftia]|jgi:diguanylate cyclase (GGDEF)-like protein|uniref:diguanylate cyclase n=4 Tax=cellular organisms TaxID=131567 RepID=A0A2G7TC68_9FLAO|nr:MULTISPECIES: GGDEF domain-containing protein [Delftia]AEF92286.1 diguanylate cyclase [Delftia sp. Cs1-4]MCA1067969.1 putative signaling protein [Delftia acidovorans]
MPSTLPTLDFFSMTAVVAINMMAMSAALPLAMGRRVSGAARHAQHFFLMQAVAWTLILIASRLPHGLMGRDLLSLGAAALAATAQWQMARALREWLGPRPMLLERGLIALCVLGPLGFALLLPQAALRTGWFSAVHGLCLMALAGLCLDPQRPVARSWRYLMCGVAAFMGLMLFVRSYLALATPFLPSFTADSGANQIFALLTTLSSTLLMVAVLVAWRDETSQQLRDLALQDMLTGLPNRRALLERAPAMLAHAQRHRQALALVMLDLDHFKHVNDEHGHAVGDQTLCLFARLLQQQLRSDEIAARWGGEEFCLLLYTTDDGVDTLCTRLQSALLQASRKVLGFEVRFSAGCAHAPQAWNGLCLELMLAPADAALYAAKRRGRDCWTQVRLSPVAASEEQGPQPSASIPEQAMAHGRTPGT